LTEGTGSNAGTCLINLDWNDRKQSVVEIMAELEENLKVYQVQILNFPTASGTWLWSCRRI
jgi:hypothetical protein